jgi:hypothetical protein
MASAGCSAALLIQMLIDAAVAAPIGVGIDPMQMMMNARDLPTLELVDYTFVFD